MRAGLLRHRVTIEAPTETQNEFGEPVAGWKPFIEAWASREDLAGRETFQAQQVSAEVTTRFWLRYVDGITAKMRLISDGVVYNVHSVADPDGRRRALVLLAERKG
jgi:SPP1 family predicted phage head-tail adaptor